MKRQRKEPRFSHSITLASILGSGFSLFLYFQYNKEAQAFVILITAIAYVLWGILHHKLTHYLTYEIVFEYILVAMMGSLVVLSLIGY